MVKRINKPENTHSAVSGIFDPKNAHKQLRRLTKKKKLPGGAVAVKTIHNLCYLYARREMPP